MTFEMAYNVLFIVFNIDYITYSIKRFVDTYHISNFFDDLEKTYVSDLLRLLL